MFSVAENSPAGTNVGTPVTGLDADGDDLTYTLKGASEFTIDSNTAQIEVASGANLDYESGVISYRVKVLVTDGLDENGDSDDSADDYVMVTINVTDVDEPPAAPAAPTLAVDPDSPKTALDVSWTAPDNTGRPAITDYDLRYRVENATGWTDHPVTGTTTNANISGLDKDTDYEVQVRATNDEGTGDWSDIGAGSTDGEPAQPNSRPQFPSTTSVVRQVAENSPAGTDVGQRFTATDADGDALKYGLSGASEFTINETTGQVEVAEGADLDYERVSSYTVRVRVTDGLNANGGSDPSADDITVITINIIDVDEAPAKPAAPTLTADASSPKSALAVEWQAPSNTGPAITSYDLRYRAQGADGWTSHAVTGTTTTATLSGLDDNTAYEAQVRATNDEGVSEWSDSGEGTTAKDNAAPAFPTNGSATRKVAENSPAGTTVGAPVAASDADGDDLTYSLSGTSAFTIDSATGQIAVADAADLNYEAVSSYTVTVSVSDGADTFGNPDPSADDTITVTITVTDVDEPPAKPAVPTVSVDTDSPTSSLVVTWNAPSNTGPAITSYDLRYRAQNTTLWTTHAIEGATSATLTGLADGTTYEAQVRATNAEGTGDWSDSGAGVTDTAFTPTTRRASSHETTVTRRVADNSVASLTVTAPEDKSYERGETITAFEVEVSGGPATVVLTGLPVGLSYANGSVSGTVSASAAVGSYKVAIAAADGAGDTASAEFTIYVTETELAATGATPSQGNLFSTLNWPLLLLALLLLALLYAYNKRRQSRRRIVNTR